MTTWKLIYHTDEGPSEYGRTFKSEAAARDAIQGIIDTCHEKRNAGVTTYITSVELHQIETVATTISVETTNV